MDFFDQQDSARRASRWLVLWYLVAVLFVVACFDAAAVLIHLAVTWGQWLPPRAHAVVAGTVAGIILVVTARRMWQLSEGGPAVAAILGAHYLERSRVTPAEAKLLNVVEEMAIASGISVPPVYLLHHEDAINALVAGHTPNEAVIVATRGAVQKLSRDELQGVMGHEFSHILNGDMALNVRLVGLLAGIACFGEWGEALVYE
ncbi:MAG TPA: M48 family metalloprotease, partial [Burkholderiales bacterium]|nr:M48 family metalloprotease [Burkholderiales bacterium]